MFSFCNSQGRSVADTLWEWILYNFLFIFFYNDSITKIEKWWEWYPSCMPYTFRISLFSWNKELEIRDSWKIAKQFWATFSWSPCLIPMSIHWTSNWLAVSFGAQCSPCSRFAHHMVPPVIMQYSLSSTIKPTPTSINLSRNSQGAFAPSVEKFLSIASNNGRSLINICSNETFQIPFF